MITEIVFYISEIILFYIIAPFAIGMAIKKIVKYDSSDNLFIELVLWLGLGPAITTLVLYYLLLCIPHMPNMFYVLTILFFFFCISVYSRKTFNSFISQILTRSKIFFRKNLAISRVILSLACLYTAVWQTIVITVPIIRHDTLEYAVFGKTLYLDKQISYERNNYNVDTSFYFVGRHGYSFPLFLTLEKIFGNTAGIDTDYFFRSISGFYLGLIAALLFLTIYKENKTAAYIFTAILAFTPAIGINIVLYHIDAYRIFLILVTLKLLSDDLRARNFGGFLLAGIFGGIAANAHTLGSVLVAIATLAYFIASKARFSNRAKRALIFLVLILVFGGIHYVLDTVFGTGWIIFRSPLIRTI